jgi:NAD-dependent dihydropyrimidine dehydrogenase PreA subunit
MEPVMTIVISAACAGTCDTSCVDVCPVDCIEGPLSVAEIKAIQASGDQAKLDYIQLYIDPETCIDCGVCIPECPVEAIFEDHDVTTDAQRLDIKRNADFFKGR